MLPNYDRHVFKKKLKTETNKAESVCKSLLSPNSQQKSRTLPKALTPKPSNKAQPRP